MNLGGGKYVARGGWIPSLHWDMKPESDGFPSSVHLLFPRGPPFLGSMFSFPGCTIYDFVLRKLADGSLLTDCQTLCSICLSPGSCLTVKT